MMRSSARERQLSNTIAARSRLDLAAARARSPAARACGKGLFY